MATPQTASNVLSDLVRDELSENYNRVEGKVKNADVDTPMAIANVLGYPVLALTGGSYPLAVAGDEANIAGLILVNQGEALDLAFNTVTTKKYVIMNRGPAIISPAALPTEDGLGGNFDMTAFKARLEALGIKVATNPPNSLSQPLP